MSQSAAGGACTLALLSFEASSGRRRGRASTQLQLTGTLTLWKSRSGSRAVSQHPNRGAGIVTLPVFIALIVHKRGGK